MGFSRASANSNGEPSTSPHNDFETRIAASGWAGGLTRTSTRVLQINVGKRCNQACHHCHVDAGPNRTEIMVSKTAERVLDLLRASPSIETVDITGGAPELNPNFRRLVTVSRELNRHVIVRCNLTVIFEPGVTDLVDFYFDNAVEIIASLPCYSVDNVDKQRGKGVFDKSIEALQLLNARGFGMSGTGLALNLVYNPVGDFLPPAQVSLEADYKEKLRTAFGIEFNNLYTITNMPINRFAKWLERNGKYESYMELLYQHFNPATLDGLMCRDQVSIGWEGTLYDCDFNQMLPLPLGAADEGASRTIWDVETFESWEGLPIAIGTHCFGCTAGAGSSCGGALE
jgi:radical SAM/Cys-rich protein